MPDPPTRPSPRSLRSSPPLELELRGSRRLAAAWALWSLALAAGLLIGCALPWWCRLGLSALAAGAGWRGALTLLSAGGLLRWEADGRWRHAEPALPAAYVQPGPLQRLGLILWLRWPTSGGHRYFPVDGSGVEPKAWRALKARMKFSGPVGHSRAP